MSTENFLSYVYSKSINEHQDKIRTGMSDHEIRVNSCLKLALSVAKQYHAQSGTKMSLEDVTQYAFEGVCIASQRYNDPNVKFSAYAYHWIKKCVLDAINITARPLAVSNVEGFGRVTDEIKFLSKDAKFSNGSDDMEGDKNPIYNSLTADSLTEDLADYDVAVNSTRSAIKDMLSSLNAHELKVTCCYFGLAPFEAPSSIQQVAAQFRYSKPIVELIINNSIINMKNYAEAHGMDLQELLTEAKTLSNVKTKESIADDYMDRDFYKKSEIDDNLKAIQDASGLTDEQMQMAINFDLADGYHFIAKREIAGLTLYQRHTIIKRFGNGRVTLACVHSIFDKNGNMRKEETFTHINKSVPIWEFSKYCKEHRINQMHSPIFPAPNGQLIY
ncbi:RNA polymerase sigma factor [Chryseobacterium phage MA9V-2]|nr:RNA polymerase sigma factor [Chryseobacterium phage MA9V-2]